MRRSDSPLLLGAVEAEDRWRLRSSNPKADDTVRKRALTVDTFAEQDSFTLDRLKSLSILREGYRKTQDVPDLDTDFVLFCNPVVHGLVLWHVILQG